MSMHPKGPLKKPKQQVQVDLKQADTIKCNDCNNYLFITSFVLKKLSAIVSPTGQETLIPVQVYSCGNCGKVAEGFLEGSGLEEELKSCLPEYDELILQYYIWQPHFCFVKSFKSTTDMPWGTTTTSTIGTPFTT